MKRVSVSFLLCFVLGASMFAQTTSIFDSLMQSKKAKDLKYLREFADSLNDIYKLDDAVKIYNSLLQNPKIKNDKRELAAIYLGLGDCYDDKQDFRKSITNYNTALQYVNQLNDTAFLVRNLVGIAGAYTEAGSNDTSIRYMQEAMTLAEKNTKKYHRYLNTIYNNIALDFNAKSNFTESLKYFFKAVEITTKSNDKIGLASTYNNLGNLYSDLGEQEKALFYYRKVLEITPTSYTYSNISIMYYDMGQIDSSLSYIKESIRLDTKNKDKAGLSSGYTVLGNIFKKKGSLDSAFYYYKISSELADEIGDLSVVQNNNFNIIECLVLEHKYKDAKVLSHKNIESLLEGGDYDFIADSYNQLRDIYSKLGDYKSAYLYQEQYMLYKDSALAANKGLEIKKIELTAEYKQKSSNDSLLHAHETLLSNISHQSEINKQRLILGGFIFILIIVAVFSVWVYRRYKISQKQSEIINLQKNEMYNQKRIVEEKQKEILDSIHYAKRIQYALIAHKDFIDEHLPENFIYFNPKDIVSGDFYWATKRDHFFYLAICDSTGHGVPGAFMSLLNIGFLSEAINEKGILEPNKVFDFVRIRLEQSISKDGQKDGFDGILLRYDMQSKKMDYAAANNSPVLISDGAFVELPKDRMPVGVGERKNDFSLYTIDAKSGDKLYFYTDGFADQFGGPKGKKYKYRKLNDLLTATDKTMAELPSFLSDEFQSWRGDLEQVDDVCIIGLKV